MSSPVKRERKGPDCEADGEVRDHRVRANFPSPTPLLRKGTPSSPAKAGEDVYSYLWPSKFSAVKASSSCASVMRPWASTTSRIERLLFKASFATRLASA